MEYLHTYFLPLLFTILVDSEYLINMPKYSKKAEKKIGKVMHEFKKGKLKSGGSDKKVTSRKQAIAIGISEAREEGAKVPKKRLRIIL